MIVYLENYLFPQPFGSCHGPIYVHVNKTHRFKHGHKLEIYPYLSVSLYCNYTVCDFHFLIWAKS